MWLTLSITVQIIGRPDNHELGSGGMELQLSKYISFYYRSKKAKIPVWSRVFGEPVVCH